MNTYILGINLGHDSSAALIEYKKRTPIVLFAASEERYTKIKNDDKFPVNSVREALKYLPPDCLIKKLCYCTWEKDEAYNLWNRWLRKSNYPCPQYLQGLDNLESLNEYRKNNFKDSVSAAQDYNNYKEILVDFIRERCDLDIAVDKVFRIEHHLSHALSAWYFSNFEECHVYISDGIGDDLSHSMSKVERLDGNKFVIRREFSGSIDGSLGLFYKYVTKGLGFNKLGEEGKVTGLAAIGEPTYAEIFERLFDIDTSSLSIIKKWNISESYLDAFRLEDKGSERFHPIQQWERYHAFGREVVSVVHNLTKNGATKEDISSSAQYILEKYILAILRNYFANTKENYLALAGGVFANVKLNQRIKELDEIRNLFVAPPMGDQGTAVGAALADLTDDNSVYEIVVPSEAFLSMYLGNSYSDKEIESSLLGHGSSIRYSKFGSVLETWNSIADFLSRGKIIARFTGKMEFGPRALGSRSIYAPANLKEIANILNDKLKRDSFMPFAPITLFENINESYIGYEKIVPCMKFMTISLNVKHDFKQQYPSAVHVDDTARPQIASLSSSKDAYEILKRYYEKTGRHTLINTSFNMHGEPIVLNPSDAIMSFISSGIDALFIENYIVTV